MVASSVRILDRVAHVDLRREMEDDLGPGVASKISAQQIAVANIGNLLEPRRPRNACSRFDRFPVERLSITVTLVAAGDQRVDDVRSDESGATGHDAVHTPAQVRR